MPGDPEILVRVRELHQHGHEPATGEDQHSFLVEAGGDFHRLQSKVYVHSICLLRVGRAMEAAEGCRSGWAPAERSAPAVS